jgi:hydroxyacylglutathione hydrolase
LSLQVITVVNGKWRQNCYVVATETGDAVIIDPGSSASEIAETVASSGLRVHAILNTHGHYDHIGAVAVLKERYQVPFYLHGGDEQLLRRANLYRLVFEAKDTIKVPTIDRNIAELPREFRIGPIDLSWIDTPGHTDGGVSFQIENSLFCGDTLMRGKIGRTDLPGGDRAKLLVSVRKLAGLPRDTLVYGGHGKVTTVEEEFCEGSKVRALLEW